METLRNLIRISGLADAHELPRNSKSQIIQYSETDTIFIPEDRPCIKSIFQILINIEIRSTRNIHTPIGRTIIIDGIKKLKIIYSTDDGYGKANFIDLELPYNTFAEVPISCNW